MPFGLLYERLKNGIFRYVFYMTNSRTAAEEATQEVVLTLLRKAQTYDPAHGELGAFTFGLARNIVRQVQRRERAYHSVHEHTHEEDAAVVGEWLAGEHLYPIPYIVRR